MKVKVINSFIDAKKKVIQKEGTIIDMKKERFEEIMSINNELLEEIKEEQPPTGNNKNDGGQEPETEK